MHLHHIHLSKGKQYVNLIFSVSISEHFVHLEISKYFSLVTLLAFTECKSYFINSKIM